LHELDLTAFDVSAVVANLIHKAILCALRQILLGWSSHRWWDGMAM